MVTIPCHHLASHLFFCALGCDVCFYSDEFIKGRHPDGMGSTWTVTEIFLRTRIKTCKRLAEEWLSIVYCWSSSLMIQLIPGGCPGNLFIPISILVTVLCITLSSQVSTTPLSHPRLVHERNRRLSSPAAPSSTTLNYPITGYIDYNLDFIFNFARLPIVDPPFYPLLIPVRSILLLCRSMALHKLCMLTTGGSG